MTTAIWNIHYKPIERVLKPPFNQYKVSQADDIEPRFADLRCHYHVWRHPTLQTDIMGFQGYRKNMVFSLSPTPGWHHVSVAEFHREQDRQIEDGGEWVEDALAGYDILITAPYDLRPLGGMYADFCRSRSKEDIDKLIDRCPEYNWEQPHVISHFFVMRKDLFNEFMTEWWSKFGDLHIASADNRGGEQYRSRAFAFLTERFFTVWLAKRDDLKKLTVPLYICWEAP
jgi:hypothetical protein